jgi:hypothetical protein
VHASISRSFVDIVAKCASQMRAVLSSDAVTIRPPSGLKAAEVTQFFWWPRRTAISVAVAASQMRVVLSHDAVTMRAPSGLKAAECTSFSWPRRTAISLAVAASQMRAVLSRDAVTMRVASGLKAAEWPGGCGWLVYSIAASARPSSVSGNARPSAFAVFVLITSSIFVTNCTGRSAGLSPFRMRPM